MKTDIFKGKSVLVTGGTGSFGRHFSQRLLKDFDPARLIIFSRDEFKQFEMQQVFTDSRMRFFIGDIRDKERLMLAMDGVDFVVHAAAMKQVPASEYNPMEAVKTNIIGSQNVVDACLRQEVQRVVALSTDKAANPVNLYGATKLASDKLIIAGNNIRGKAPTRFAVVRYGNVVGSRGSVIPFFQKLIAAGADHLPITHPDMTRFWITLDQGVQFVIDSFYRMHGGEIFVPKIPSIKITDLAHGMAPHIPQKIVGIRPGEKIHEVMCPPDEAHLTLEFDHHYVIQPTISVSESVVSFDHDGLGEKGRLVPDFFEYSSGRNTWFLSADEVKDFNFELEH